MEVTVTKPISSRDSSIETFVMFLRFKGGKLNDFPLEGGFGSSAQFCALRTPLVLGFPVFRQTCESPRWTKRNALCTTVLTVGLRVRQKGSK